MWFKSSPAWAPCEQRKHFLISDTKTHKHSNTQRATQVIKMVWNSFTLWNVNFLIIEICFLNISFSPLLMSCIRLSRLAISVVVFFVCFKSSLSILHRQFNEFNRLFFRQPAKDTVFWHQIAPDLISSLRLDRPSSCR